MKVQVVVKNSNKASPTSTTLEAIVGATDTVTNVMEYVASTTKTFSFPDQKILFNGKALAGKQRLSDCGIKEGSVLEFVFQGSEQNLIQQLSDLLEKKTLALEELNFLYSYRYAASFEDALKAVGHGDGNIRDFMEGQKCFSIHGHLVKVVQAIEKVEQQSAGLCSIKEDRAHGVIEVSVSIEVHVAGKSPEPVECDEDDDIYMSLESSDTVAKAKAVIAAYEQMPFQDLDLMLGETKLEDGISLSEAGVKNGSALVLAVHASESSLSSQLEELLWERAALSPSELGLLYCQRFGTPVVQALRTLGLHGNLRRFLEGQSRFLLTGGCVTLADGPKLVTPLSPEQVVA